MQKLYCPMCHKLLIKNADLVIDDIVQFDIEKILKTKNEVKTITCYYCKRKIKYFIEKEGERC